MKQAKPAVNKEFQKCIDKAGNQVELALKVNCSQQAINNIALGKKRISLQMAIKLSHLFNGIKKEKLRPDFEW